jgi:hypothetical protein
LIDVPENRLFQSARQRLFLNNAAPDLTAPFRRILNAYRLLLSPSYSCKQQNN